MGSLGIVGSGEPGSGAGYVELHARSAFSFLRGSSQPEALVERAGALGMGAVGVLDRDGFYGSARVHHAGRERGVRGVVGCEVTMEDGSVVPVLVAARSGYRALCHWLTTAKLRAPKGEGAMAWAELEACAEEAGRGALVALTGDGEGAVRRALGYADYAGTAAAAQRLVRVFGREHVAVELQRHQVRGEGWTNRRLVELARTLRLPLLATNGTTYAAREGRFLADAFTCLREHVALDGAGTRLARNGQCYLKSPAQMAGLFGDLPEAVAHSARLAEQLEFTLEDLGYEFPGYRCRDGESAEEVLRRETYAGARYRYGVLRPRVREQLEHELALIARLGFCGYFLVVWDIVNAARDMGVMVQGRGSAANSAVCYSLGITACDPVGHELLFERFLSEGRRSWPDIDLDLPSGDRRESVIQWVYERYRPRGAAMTANVITYRGRSAMREMGKVLGIQEDVLGRFSDLFAAGDFHHTLELGEHLERAGMPAGHPRAGALVRLYQAVYGLPRHLGQHSGGMVISDKGLDRIVPLENASMPGRVVVQWDKDDCEDLGIVKVDLLGLGMMSAIQDAIETCADRGAGRAFDIARLPADDPETFQLLREADTVGVFQVESRAQMATLPRMKPTCFYDLVVEVALIRPGPIVGDLVHPYLNRRAGKEAVDFIHPVFEPVLRRTLGVPLFQEQVLKMAMLIADFTGTEADELRRAMSFHRSEERMRKVMDKLRAAMGKKGVAPEVQEKVVNSVCSFALYGFPESHAISFGMLAYASAWMKAHRAVEFYAALLNNQPMGFYSPATLVKDAKRHGVRCRPVDVTASEPLCRVEDNQTLRLGLCVVRGLGSEAAERITTERDRRPFANLDDFLLRTGLSKNERRTLAKIGALNGLDGAACHRRGALWAVEAFTDPDDLFSLARAKARRGEEEVQQKDTKSAKGREGEIEQEEREGTKRRNGGGRIEQKKTEGTEGTEGRKRGEEFQQKETKGAKGKEEEMETEGTEEKRGEEFFQKGTKETKGGGEKYEDDENRKRVPAVTVTAERPLRAMEPIERLEADYDGTGLTTGPHPVAYLREGLAEEGIARAADLAALPPGRNVTVAGMVICRQRPGTAKGHLFVSLEDETGIANAFVPRPTFEKFRLVLTQERFLKIHGRLQNSEGSISVYTHRVDSLPFDAAVHPESHDFH